MFAIQGSGFGLYGYLAAIVGGGWGPVALPEAYRARLEERPELARFRGAVRWFADEREALAQSSAVVVARRPADQGPAIAAIAARRGPQLLVLEKPLACEPAAAARCLALLIDARLRFRIGYNFRFTSWSPALAEALRRAGSQSTLRLQWHFLAHHHRNALDTWKRRHSEGGGALRYYGIHLIALLAETGYTRVEYSLSAGGSRDECDRWECALGAPGLPRCVIELDTLREAPCFAASIEGAAPRELFRLTDPYSAKATENGLDPRVLPLQRLIAEAMQDTTGHFPEWYRDTIRLWQAVESADRRLQAATSA
jgi:hypothetical protein